MLNQSEINNPNKTKIFLIKYNLGIQIRLLLAKKVKPDISDTSDSFDKLFT